MTRAQLESELALLQRKRINLNNRPYDGDVTGHLRKSMQSLERRESKILSELAAMRGIVSAPDLA